MICGVEPLALHEMCAVCRSTFAHLVVTSEPTRPLFNRLPAAPTNTKLSVPHTPVHFPSQFHPSTKLARGLSSGGHEKGRPLAMGGGAGGETTKKALRATASDGDGASVPPVEQQQKQQPVPLPAAGVTGTNAADGSASAAVQSCGEEDGQDDEQVERFYALLANIRALRGLYSAGAGPAASVRGSRKRAREAEAPWTPAFRLEDFEEEVNQGAAAADARCAVMNQGASGGAARRPAAARARVAAADDGHEEDGVAEVERGGNKLGRRVAARG